MERRRREGDEGCNEGKGIMPPSTTGLPLPPPPPPPPALGGGRKGNEVEGKQSVCV